MPDPILAVFAFLAFTVIGVLLYASRGTTTGGAEMRTDALAGILAGVLLGLVLFVLVWAADALEQNAHTVSCAPTQTCSEIVVVGVAEPS